MAATVFGSFLQEVIRIFKLGQVRKLLCLFQPLLTELVVVLVLVVRSFKLVAVALIEEGRGHVAAVPVAGALEIAEV